MSIALHAAVPRRHLPAVAVAVTVAGLAVSAWNPHDRTTWFLETVWVLVGLPLVVLTRRRFPLTDLLCCLLAAHALVLAVGGHYTYAQVPVGDWVRDTFGLARNPYDRFGHLMQGFVPAVLVRELLSRTSPLRGSRWLAPLTVCACLAFSAVFEMLEWLAAVVGGHYTYAQVPLGNWLRDELGLERNPYDRFGHLMQGFVPAVLVRELLSRTSPLRGSRWLAPLTVCACLAFSAVFEMLEWLAAVVGGQAADAFLATQGDVWDTQWDMFCALVGATVSVLVLSRVHDRQLAKLPLPDVTSSYSGAAPTAGRRTSTRGTTPLPR